MRKLIFILFLSLLTSGGIMAQCAMCKRVAETDMDNKHKETAARGLNNGILYLLSVPYLIGGVGAAAWWWNRRKNQQ